MNASTPNRFATLAALCLTAGAAGADDAAATAAIRLRLAPPPVVHWEGPLFGARGDPAVLDGELVVRCMQGQRYRLDAPDVLLRDGAAWEVSGERGEQACSGRAQRHAFVARRNDAGRNGEHGDFGVTFY